MQKIFRAMKRYGLILADNGSDMYITGTMDARWNNDVLNPAFHSLRADDFEVVELGWGRGTPPSRQPICGLSDSSQLASSQLPAGIAITGRIGPGPRSPL